MRIKPKQADQKLRQMQPGDTLAIPEPALPSEWIIRKVTQRTYELFTADKPYHPGRIQRWEARQILTSTTGW